MSVAQQALAERQSLLSKLLDAVKQCQIRFGGRTELATDGDRRVACLCSQFEVALQHGLRKNYTGLAAIRHVTEIVTGINLTNTECEPVFWHVIRDHLTKHEYERYMLLKNVTTEAGRGRAWLRSALNEHSLERYIHMLLGDPGLLSQYYEDFAFLVDQERSSMLPMMAAGLGSILFAINIDNPDLNTLGIQSANSVGGLSNSIHSDPTPVIASSPADTAAKEKKKKKKALAQIVSFDDGLNGSSRCVPLSPSYFSAPPTCLSSPTELVAASVLNDMPSGEADDSTATGCPRLEVSASPTVLVSNSESPCKWTLEGEPTLENCVSNNSDIDCSGSYDDLQPSEESHGSVPGDASALEALDLKAYKSKEYISSKEMEMESHDTYNNIGNLEEIAERLQNSTLSDGKKLPDVLLHSETTTLTPVNDTSVGELIPISGYEEVHSEDSVSLPSYSEDSECAAAALALQKVLQNSGNSGMQLHLDNSPSSNMGQSGKHERSESLSNGDLRHAIIAMMQKKEEADEQNKSLRSLLDREMEMCSGLRVEIEDLKKKHGDKVDKLQIKIQALSRENELLKHQLKKYVGAVQMLKRDGGNPNEALASLTGDSTPAIPEAKPYIDYHLEATEYERKLIQVAEMHGELMEFNERLHRLLSQKEAVVRRLREELVDLRGPLPDDNQTSDDDMSVTSDYDTCSMTASTRALINIWIPSAFLTGKSSDSHHVYQVYIRIRDDEWNIYRRYAQFYALHKSLKKKNPIVNTFNFPPKKAIGNKDAKFVEERRKRLQHYLRCVVNLLVQNYSELTNSPDKEALVGLMPFFGEVPNSDDNSRRRGSRNLFSRSAPGPSTDHLSQHYTGL